MIPKVEEPHECCPTSRVSPKMRFLVLVMHEWFIRLGRCRLECCRGPFVLKQPKGNQAACLLPLYVPF